MLSSSVLDRFKLGGYTAGVLNVKKAPRPMTNVVSALTARTQFGQIMRRAAAKNEASSWRAVASLPS